MPLKKLPTRPMVVTIAMLKGGAGKTTSAVFTALRYAALGYSVELLDGDPVSQSAHDWAKLAAARAPLPFRVERYPFADVAAELAARRQAATADVIVVDAGGGTPEFVSAAAAESDVVLMTLAPSAADARRVAATLEAVELGAARNARGLVVFFAIVRADKRSAEPERWRAQLEGDGHPVLDTTISSLVMYSRAFGTCPDDVGEYEPLWAEVESELAVNA